MDAFVTSTSRDDDAPPQPKASIGKLPKGERPASLPRGKGELYQYVAAYADWGRKEKNAGTEQFRYLVRTMDEVEARIKAGEKTLKDLQGQVRGWQRSVAEKDAVSVYETTGEKMQQKLTDLRGDVGKKHLEKVFAPDGGLMGKLNELVLEMQVWLAEESKLGGKQIIEDRLIFAATNLAPLLRLRGRFIFEMSSSTSGGARSRRRRRQQRSTRRRRRRRRGRRRAPSSTRRRAHRGRRSAARRSRSGPGRRR